MSPRQAVEARPRSTIEILDDAWRIYFADPLLLLALTVLLYFPALTCLVLLVADPVASTTLWLPALTALLLPLTGLSAGACQEAFYSWAEDYPASFGQCLGAACQRGLSHIASQAILLVGPVGMVICLVAPNWPSGLRIVGVIVFALLAGGISLFSLSLQPSFAAGKPRFWRAVRYAFQSSGRHFGRAVVLVYVRNLLLFFAVFNLHLFVNFALWTAEHLAGFDCAYLGVLCSLGNGAYTLSLVLLSWCLLRPFNEAVSYLFFVDARTRYEGLDLWQRVQDLFTAKKAALPEPKRAAGLLSASPLVGAILLVTFLVAMPVSAAQPLPAVRAARQEIGSIRGEVKAAKPYPGGQLWLPRLEKVADGLEASVAKPAAYRWVRTAIVDFPTLGQPGAVNLLDDLDAQLALVEESLSRPRQSPAANAPTRDQIKKLIPPEKHKDVRNKNQQVEKKKDKKDDRPPVEQADRVGGDFGPRAGPGVVGSTAIAGAANGLLILLIGFGAAVLVAGLAYVLYQWLQNRAKAMPRQAGTLAPRPDSDLDDPGKQDPLQLWRQADDRAKAGDYLGAVRTLYLAVLAMLHQGGFIRYERTRTNGEYADQLRPRVPLQRPFLRLTGLFELKWYGQRSCESNDYHHCRQLAEEIRVGAVAP